jgi:hypothetical protein
MHINVRRVGEHWILLQRGSSTPDCFKGLADALHEAGLRFRLAGRHGSASLSISYDKLPAGSHALELEAAR